MANVGRKGIVRYEDTFAINTIGTSAAGTDRHDVDTQSIGLAWECTMDTGATPFARAMSVSKGMHVRGSTDGTDNDMLEFNGDQLMFYGSTGFNAVEIMVQFDSAENIAFNFGFNDEVTEGSDTGLPIIGSAAAMYSTATTFLGFVFDQDLDNKELHCFWVDDDVETTKAIGDLRMKGMSIVANKWLFLRVEMQSRGSGAGGVHATFHAEQEEKSMTKEFDTTVDEDVALCYYFGMANRSGLAHGVFIKLPAWEQSIAD